MLSICIPVYNFDITRLVNDLHQQALAVGIPFEIIAMDDASQVEYRIVNGAIEFPGFRYIQLDHNIGRSKIRNQLVTEAQYPYLIFMDCDSAVSSDRYVSNYLDLCKPLIVCYGGRTYSPIAPKDNTYLRWKYGVEKESLTAVQRKNNSSFGFSTNNFLIDRHVFQKVRFNEALLGYGHEDTLFGLELQGLGIPIEHIDNPLIHLGLEDAAAFIEKTENGVINLCKMEQIIGEKYPQLRNHSKLLKAKLKLEKLHLTFVFSVFFQCFKPIILRNLLGKKPSMFLFDIYKLGVLTAIK